MSQQPSQKGGLNVREAAFERFVCEKIRMAGGRAFKWVCPGVTGAPDRICIFPGARIVFVELKRPGLKDGRSERQKKVCRLLEGFGFDVRRIGEKEELIKMLEDLGYAV